MFKKLALLLAVAVCVSCATESWIPVGDQQQRAPVNRADVVFLDSPPTRPHTVVGIITPPAGEYETEAEAVKAMRKQAAKYGADALYIESQSESGGWKFGTMGGLSGGSFSEMRFRAKAIAWK